MRDAAAAAGVQQEDLAVGLTPPQAVAATSARLYLPPAPPAAVAVLGHGAGSNHNSAPLRAVGAALAGAGCAVMTFNFAYAEAQRRGPDPMPRLRSAYTDAIAAARDRFGEVPLFLGGRSMGGRLATMLVADGTNATGLVLLGYPLHPAGRPDKLRVDHWPDLDAPLLFLSGSRDSLFSLELFAQHRAALPGPVKLHVLDDADHGFHVRKSSGRSDADVLREVCDESVAFVTSVLADQHAR